MSDVARGRDALLAAGAVVPHTDADGLAAGALALRARGEPAGRAVLLGRGQTPFGPGAPLPGGPVPDALALLVESSTPAEALAHPRAAALDEARRAWRAEYDRVRRTAPVVGERVALVRFSSPAQVHPLVAAQWQRRLAPRVVIAANDGYLPGRVNFSVRGGTGDLRSFLRRALPDATGELAHGHDRATGGSLDPAEFERLLRALG